MACWKMLLKASVKYASDLNFDKKTFLFTSKTIQNISFFFPLPFFLSHKITKIVLSLDVFNLGEFPLTPSMWCQIPHHFKTLNTLLNDRPQGINWGAFPGDPPCWRVEGKQNLLLEKSYLLDAWHNKLAVVSICTTWSCGSQKFNLSQNHNLSLQQLPRACFDIPQFCTVMCIHFWLASSWVPCNIGHILGK